MHSLTSVSTHKQIVASAHIALIGGISVYPAFAARKAGRGNDRVWKAWKAVKPASHLPTLFGNPFGITTFPPPRRRDRYFKTVCKISTQLKLPAPQGACNGCLRSTA